ncbi:disease resistance protein (TIR-NBS-LRR class) [Medicago truncatula]|uniref:Disease resistance protein (TIR-NBS-LRR class) n=1 Tax=Medicago truncatula TaxID=3880 RepID=G7KF73_MEDTR|nr:disease resistance protein (TIR-NBS-LRR class) [Medicago truncatula]
MHGQNGQNKKINHILSNKNKKKNTFIVKPRGQDTVELKGFCEKGINTFIDDQELRKGEEITPALMMAIVIFSENYASSTFCLEALRKIMEFDPSDVRHQKGSYAKAIVKQWRLALQEAANLVGWHFRHRYDYEYELIGKIVQKISKKINRRPLHVAKYHVGLESRVQKVNSLLEVESDEKVKMVGIFGMGGLGKTALACAVYNCIADQFDSLCFLADVRENSKKHGLKDLNLCSLNRGISIIKSRLHRKKILLSDVMILLSGHGLAPDYPVQVMIDKSLIKIDEYRVRMHHMIEDMDREIVSRLWFYKVIIHVFKEKKGSDKIEIIMLHLLKDKKVQWDGNALKKMENLKILIVEKARFSRGPYHLPKSLRILK